MKLKPVVFLLILLLGSIVLYPLSLSAQDKENLVGEIKNGNLNHPFKMMVIPYLEEGESVKLKYNTDPNYRVLINEISAAFIENGYHNLLDFRTHYESILYRTTLTNEIVKSSLLKIAIENAPVDVLIEAEILLDSQRTNPNNKQVSIRLTAIDKYSALILSSTSHIKSNYRQVQSLKNLIDVALTIDGKTSFIQFLAQLDRSLELIEKQGRTLKIKFEIAKGSSKSFLNRSENKQISTLLEQFIRLHSINEQCRQMNVSAQYIDFSINMAVLDKEGIPISYMQFIDQLSKYLGELGMPVKDVSMVGSWINFIIE